MTIDVLIATMNQNEHTQLLENMNIKDNYVIINQIVKKEMKKPTDIEKEREKFYSFYDKGLSKSRNMAIRKSNADICIIADDDMYYTDDYEETINNAYEKYEDADIIAFVVEHENTKDEKNIMKEGRIHFVKSMKISSVQITFKRESIINKNIKFNENFGAGARYYFGEENIFLAKCLQAGLKIYYVPKKIATLRISDSTWFKGHTEENYNISGAVFYEMSKHLYPLLIVQFVLRKKWLYGEYLKPRQVAKYMFVGTSKYKKENRKHIYYMGDFCTNSGPAIVNKNYYNYMKEKSYICKTNSKIVRLLHFLYYIRKCNVLLISGLSRFHLVSAKEAKKMKKKVVYLMHGYCKLEYTISNVPMEERFLQHTEEQLLNVVDKVICVSEKFCQLMKKNRMDISKKFDFVNNGIERISNLQYKKNKENNKKKIIVSVGGGVKIKNNLNVCKAIKRIDNEKIDFIVIGQLGQDGEKIKQYNFVKYYESLSHAEVLKKMSIANLYIQNSYFETFGLSVIEAISMNCKILVSKNVGALSIIDDINENMIIQDNEDIIEIQEKIERNLKDESKIIYINNIEKYSWNESAKKLLKFL